VTAAANVDQSARRALIDTMDRQDAIEMIARGLRQAANLCGGFRVGGNPPAVLWRLVHISGYREYCIQRDRTYLRQLLAEHKSIGIAAKAAGVNRNTIYDIAKRCGFKLPSHPAGNRGNEAWRSLAAE
jgi:AraC-like DNA-binding protein